MTWRQVAARREVRSGALFLGELALRHVRADAEHARRAAVGGAEQLPARFEPAHFPIGTHDPVLEAMRRSIQAVRDLLEDALAVIRVDVRLVFLERPAERARHEAVDAL